jgi:hypothetical protein
MSEFWCGVTQEKFESRRDFFANLFPKWREQFCREAGNLVPRLQDESAIAWRTDGDGTVYSPEEICRIYFEDSRPRAKHLMENPEKGKLDRHKIVALTQELILSHFPITHSDERKFNRSEYGAPSTCERLLNASFAYHFALSFIGAWNKELHEMLEIPFNPDDLFSCLAQTHFAREHFKFLTLDLETPFPTVLIAQLWFALEQWGLVHL